MRKQAIGPHEDLTIVKRRKLKWYGHVSRSPRLAKTILQGTVKRRRQGRQKKRREDNTREWTGVEFAESQRAVGEQRKIEEIGCEVICGVPSTFVELFNKQNSSNEVYLFKCWTAQIS